MDEFGAEFEDLVAFTDGADAAADAVAGFEDEDLAAGFGEAAGSGEACHAGTDDQDSLSARFHLEIGCGAAREVNGNRGHAAEWDASKVGRSNLNLGFNFG